MRPAGIFFWGVCIFLTGVMIFSIAGGFDEESPDLPFGEKIELTGVVSEVEQRINSQKIIVGDIQIATSRYPEFEYGDKIKVAGTLKTIEGEWEGYFKKEGVVAMISFPKIELVSKNNGSPIKARLLRIKKFFESSYKKVLPFEQAAFLSGLTLGSTAEFSDEFKEKLRLTGVTHLVALSGYNISILIRSLGFVLSAWWLTKKLRLPLSILFVLGFVVMTGAEPSVTRAAIMAMIIALADYVQRLAYIRNAIAAAALIMVVSNPKILAFDVGFQLSFLALLGIVYLEPWIRKKFKAKDEPGFFGWRQHFWTTTSAQLAVLPLLIYHFGFVSPISIPVNVLLLEFIPITMGLGFFIGFASIVGHWLAWVVALPAPIFLSYELGIIDIFSKVMSIF